MYENELHELRREKWRLDGRPVRTLEDARAFVDSVGFCLLYAQRSSVLAPTFVGAYKGSGEKLPTAQMAFADPDAHDAKDLMVRLLREKSAYETNVFPENNFIVSASVFPYFYGVMGDRTPRQTPKAGTGTEYSPLALDAFHIIQKEGPIPKRRLQELLGGAISESALDRALDELWARLRITRVDYKPEEGVFWDELYRWSPDAVRSGTQVSVAESLTALVSKFLDCVVAAQQEEVEEFFSHLIGRARVRQAINALQATRELSYVHIGGRVMLHVSPLPTEDKELRPNPQSQAPRAGRPLVHRSARMARRTRTAEAMPPPKQTPPRDLGKK